MSQAVELRPSNVRRKAALPIEMRVLITDRLIEVERVPARSPARVRDDLSVSRQASNAASAKRGRRRESSFFVCVVDQINQHETINQPRHNRQSIK